MNQDLVDRLAAQAWRYSLNYDGEEVLPQILVFHRKLAELIVIECARVVNDNNFAGSTLGDRLLFEHFGIES
jgi:hypothetical protein